MDRRPEPAGIYALGTVDGEPFRAVAGRGWSKADKGKEFWFCPINLNRIFTSDPIPRSLSRSKIGFGS